LYQLSDLKVREELKLSEDQLKRIEELKAERRQKTAALRGLSPEARSNKLSEIIKETEAAFANFLTQNQLRRAEQMYLQRLGPRLAFTNPGVAAALKFTDEQKKKIDVLVPEAVEAFRIERAQGQTTRQRLQELSALWNEKFLDVLTPAQKKKWKQLLGPPFKWEPRGSKEPKQPSQDSDRAALSN
jgi:hypothetical protein